MAIRAVADRVRRGGYAFRAPSWYVVAYDLVGVGFFEDEGVGGWFGLRVGARPRAAACAFPFCEQALEGREAAFGQCSGVAVDEHCPFAGVVAHGADFELVGVWSPEAHL
jgi:hypothetical protein